MPSAIDPTKPVDGIPAVKADLRANLLAAKGEIEALQEVAAGLGTLAQANSITVNEIDGSGIRDATTCLLGNGTFGTKDPAQVSGGEITTGTETTVRSYSPADIVSFINQHAPAGATTSPFLTATGSQAGAASGKSWKLEGNVTAVPVTNGWLAKYVNTSGTDKTITPASGVCVKTETGSTQASVTLSNNKSCVVQGDGTNLIVDGDVT
jgi:hypothetical protein